MRQTISGLLAAISMVAASVAPAMACGGLFDGSCSPCGYASPCAQTYVPAYTYSCCYTGCGVWGFGRLPDPVQQYHAAPVGSPQYYYVDQGPTYSGPASFAPYPIYREAAVSGWGVYRHRHRAHDGHGPVLRRYY